VVKEEGICNTIGSTRCNYRYKTRGYVTCYQNLQNVKTNVIEKYNWIHINQKMIGGGVFDIEINDPGDHDTDSSNKTPQGSDDDEYCDVADLILLQPSLIDYDLFVIWQK
uniref:Uncharacterized protein n=1 Tax=Romanomermis culicivorax TaxID=13658 RepID=A0A915HLK9_ROMCU